MKRWGKQTNIPSVEGEAWFHEQSIAVAKQRTLVLLSEDVEISRFGLSYKKLIAGSAASVIPCTAKGEA